jgi:hypothetical protein
MTKYYTARITVSQELTLAVAAESSEDARRRAREQAEAQVPGGTVASIDLTLDGEIAIAAGVRVRHAVFGEGEITEVERSGGTSGRLSFIASVRWDSGKTVQLALPLPKDKLEILGS